MRQNGFDGQSPRAWGQHAPVQDSKSNVSKSGKCTPPWPCIAVEEIHVHDFIVTGLTATCI